MNTRRGLSVKFFSWIVRIFAALQSRSLRDRPAAALAGRALFFSWRVACFSCRPGSSFWLSWRKCLRHTALQFKASSLDQFPTCRPLGHDTETIVGISARQDATDRHRRRVIVLLSGTTEIPGDPCKASKRGAPHQTKHYNSEMLEKVSNTAEGTTALAVAFAACGYVAKTFIDLFIRREQKKRERFARLLKLSSLLDASWTAFENQRVHRNHLYQLIENNHPDKIPQGRDIGYEEVFSTVYPYFTPEEKELHGLIRGITVYGLRPVNLALSRWLAEDTDFRTGLSKEDELYNNLTVQLNMAARHLVLWHAKYRNWIKAPEHSLVYLNDEEHHGLAFPTGIEDLVREVIKRQKFVLPELIKTPKKTED
jgi:hypothetical protein